MSFPARYASICSSCDDEIRVDDLVKYDTGDRLVHTYCPAPRPPGKVCPSCFIELPVSGKHECDE